jgi:cell division protein ZapA (FtsZ GTPase activity inhibitor)
MRQKFSVSVADVPMNIVCDEAPATIDAAVAELDTQIRNLTAQTRCTKTEAALLCALDYSTRNLHLKEEAAELEARVRDADPTGDTYEANLLRGENETLRAQLAVSRGEYRALLQDNATLFQLNAKLVRQNGEANARADRMHDQVLSILTEVRELRERLAAMCVETRPPSPSYTHYEEEPAIEITPQEQQTTRRYEQMDIATLAGNDTPVAPTSGAHGTLLDATAEDEPVRLSDIVDFDEDN